MFDVTRKQSNSSVLEDCPKYLRTELWNQISSSSYAKLGGGSSATTDNTSSWSQENQTSSMAEDSDAPGHSRLKLVSYMKLIAQVQLMGWDVEELLLLLLVAMILQ